MSKSNGSDNIFSLIKDFVKKIKIEGEDSSLINNEIKFKNGDIVGEDQNTFSIYSSFVDSFVIKIQKDLDKNTIPIIKQIFKTFQINPKGTRKSDLINQLKEINIIKSKLNLDEDMEEESNDEDSSEESEIDEKTLDSFYDDPYYDEYGITQNQAKILFDLLFIDWNFYQEQGDIKGHMKRKNLEFIIKKKIKHKLSYFEKEGYPVILATKNKEDDERVIDENIEISYKDGDGDIKKVMIEKIIYNEYMNFLSN